MMLENLLLTGLGTHLDSEIRKHLKKACIGIAGAGGLGSNVAHHLVRSGIGRLVMADFDRISPSNLNRQFYFPDQVGQAKVAALKDNLLRINPELTFIGHDIRLDQDNIPGLFSDCTLVVEALDAAAAKALLVETLRPTGIMIVAASGIGGYGAPDTLRVRTFGKSIFIVGDEQTPSDLKIPPMSPRVGIAAAMQADLVLKHLIGTLTCQEEAP